MTLRERLDRRAHRGDPIQPTVEWRLELLREGARIALESLPCRCSSDRSEVSYRDFTCDRCARLAELSKMEGGK